MYCCCFLAFLGLNHKSDLITVLEHYAPIIDSCIHLVPDKTRKILYKNATELGKSVGHIAYSALFIMIITVCLLFIFPMQIIDNVYSPMLYWYAAIGGFIFACGYTRNAPFYSVIFMSATLFGAILAFFMLPICMILPLFFGVKTQETFVIFEKDDTRLIWQSLTHPKININIYRHPQRQRDFLPLLPLGYTQDTIVYRTTFGIHAMANTEYKILENATFQTEQTHSVPSI